MPLILTEADIMVLQGQLANKAWLLFCFILVSCSEPKDSLVVNFLSPDLDLSKNIVLYKNAPLSGVVYGLSSNALDTLWLRYYKEGLKSGVWKQYYPGGELKEIRKFVKNKKESNYRGYYKGGARNFVFQFNNGEYNGTNKVWTKGGLLIEEANFKSGYESGVQKTWYLNGKIKSNYIIKNNRRYGLLGTKNCVNVSDDLIVF